MGPRTSGPSPSHQVVSVAVSRNRWTPMSLKTRPVRVPSSNRTRDAAAADAPLAISRSRSKGMAARIGPHGTRLGELIRFSPEIARQEEARIDSEWTAHLGRRRMGQLREALELLREITDPYENDNRTPKTRRAAHSPESSIKTARQSLGEQ